MANLDLDFFGAALFGVVIGWFLYYINRYRKSDLQISDITTLLGALGGGLVANWKSPHAFSGALRAEAALQNAITNQGSTAGSTP